MDDQWRPVIDRGVAGYPVHPGVFAYRAALPVGRRRQRAAAVALATGFGVLLAYASGMHAATAILATSPGGIAEMSLTAKTLQLGVPIVTAFHVIRMVALVLLIGPLFRLLRRLHGSRETD